MVSVSVVGDSDEQLTLGLNATDSARLLAAVDHLPQGARVANLVVTNSGTWGYNAQEHIGGYAVLRKDVLINAHFAIPGVHMISTREGGPNFRDPSQRMLWRKGPIDLSNWEPAKGMDWLWYVGQREPDALPRGAVIDSVTRPPSSRPRRRSCPGWRSRSVRPGTDARSADRRRPAG